MKKRSSLIREVLITVLLTLIVFLILHFVVQSYRVDGISMQPGLSEQGEDYVMVNKLAYLFHPPQRGDVIVFYYPLDTSQEFIKRIIGLPGDTVSYDDTGVRVNGVLLHEPYISEPSNQKTATVKVPPGDYFVMGDNRPVSDDSRDWGFVPAGDLIGQAVIVYWPISHWEVINTYPQVFAGIKSPHS